MEASARILKEVFQLVIRRSNVLFRRLSIFPSAPRVCAIQVPLHYNTIVLLFVDPILCCGPHLGLSRRIRGRALVDVYVWNVIPVGVCAWVIERRPSISLRVSGSICLESWQRNCVTLGKKAEWRAVKTEYTYGRSLQSFLVLWAVVM